MTKWILVFTALYSVAASSPRVSAQPVHALRQVPNSETDNLVSELQEQAARRPGDYAGFDRLGSALLQKARETGDISYFNLAEQTLLKACNLAPHDQRAADPLVHIASVYMGEHRFTDALSYSQKAIATGSGSLDAFAIEGDAYTDMGEYEQATTAYATLQTLGSAYSSPFKLAYMIDSRMAYLRFLYGDTDQAIHLMQSAIQAAVQANLPRENLAWLSFELGERYFQSGNLDAAEAAYQSGIGADPAHYRSLAGLAKVRAAQGRLQEAIQLYQQSIAILPFPAYISELGDVFRKSGQQKAAQEQYDLVEYIGHLSKLNEALANRELALFYADHGIKLPEAIELAQKELDVRHDIYTWDTIAWVQFRNGHLQDALEAMDNAMHLHTQDPLLYFHAGMIYHGLGREAEAKEFLSRALKMNPQFHLIDVEAANSTLGALLGARSGQLETNNGHN